MSGQSLEETLLARLAKIRRTDCEHIPGFFTVVLIVRHYFEEYSGIREGVQMSQSSLPEHLIAALKMVQSQNIDDGRINTLRYLYTTEVSWGHLPDIQTLIERIAQDPEIIFRRKTT
ncbi:MAG TPA: hypothetical protein VLK22_02720 [Candidatus Udaeobacter sp.]|nr:hypothetical protein [Candidatus Udaeobacter sp.]